MHQLILLLSLLIFSCQGSKTNTTEAEKEIRSLLQQERTAHFDRNTDLFVSEFSDSMISVNKGKVSVSALDEHKKRIGSYFQSVEFIKWDDMADPVIRFSDDGSMAYAVIQKQVILKYPADSNKVDTTDYAWVSIYRKQDGKWKVECNASTTKQGY